METNPLYYIPELSEFHHGFRYQAMITKIKDNGKFKDEIFNVNRDILLETKRTRVKYLDLQDIEELEFKFYKCREAETLYKYKDFYLETSFDSHVIKITTYNHYQLFHGTIKNYNELKTLIKQLNIS